MKRTQPSDSPRSASADACCPVPATSIGTATPTARVERAGMLAAGASVFAAVASSACCWLPLLLIAFGASAGGVAATFERFRPVFLVVAPSLLALGFYLLYFRKAACGPDGACAIPNPRFRRVSRVMLWIAVVLVAAFALFPKYVGLLFASPANASSATDPARTVTLRIEGMTCEACAIRLEHDLAAIPGVRRARVEYAEGRAMVGLDSVAYETTIGRLIDAVRAAGYAAHVDATRNPTGGG